MSRTRWQVAVHAGTFALALLCARTALAADSTVQLKNGGMVRGELMEVQPNVSVRVRLADGEVRVIPWSDVARIEDASASPASGHTAPPASGAAKPSPASQGEITALQRERAEIDDSGPAVMMVVGGIGFLLFTPIGLGLFAVDSACDSTSTLTHNCFHAQGAAIVFTAIGLGSGAIALWGFIKQLNNDSRREQINQRIREARERSALGLDLAPLPGGGEFRLALRF